MTLLIKLAPQLLRSLAEAPKIRDVTQIQELGNGPSCLIRGHICQYVLHEMVLEHQDIGEL